MNDLKIYIGRSGEVIATYSILALIEAIEEGLVSHSDQAWYKGLADWMAVSEAIPPILPFIPGRPLLNRAVWMEESHAEGELPSLAS